MIELHLSHNHPGALLWRHGAVSWRSGALLWKCVALFGNIGLSHDWVRSRNSTMGLFCGDMGLFREDLGIFCGNIVESHKFGLLCQIWVSADLRACLVSCSNTNDDCQQSADTCVCVCMYRSVLQCVTVCCSVLQCVAVCCSDLSTDLLIYDHV